MASDAENFPGTAGVAPTGGLPAHPPPPPREPREIWTWRDLLWLVAFLPVAYLVSDLLAFTAYAALRPLAGWHASTDSLAKNPIFGLILQSILYIFVLCCLFLLATLQHRQPFWRSLGWKMPTVRQAAGCAVGGGGLAVATSLALWMLPDSQGIPPGEVIQFPDRLLRHRRFRHQRCSGH